MSEVESSGPGSKMLLLVGLLMGLLIGGGVMLALDLGAPPPTEEELEAKRKAEAAKPPAELFPVEFERLTVGIYAERPDGRTRYIGNYYVKVILEVANEDDKIVLERMKDRLQHGFLSTIARGTYMRDGTRDELDLDKLATLLKTKANEVIQRPLVLNVAVTEALRVSN